MSQPVSSSVAAEAATEAFVAFLHALSDPNAGEALYDAHAADAVILHGGRGRPRHEVDREAYRAAHRAAGPRYGKARLLSASEPESGILTATFAVQVETLEAPVPVGAGFREQDGAWRLVWTVVDPVPDLGFQAGAATMLSLFPLLSQDWVGAPRAWLDLGMSRDRLAPDQGEFHYLENARFSCDGSTHCCTFNWSIHLPPEAQHFIDAIPWETVAPALAGTRLKELPSGELELRARGERCRFLDEKGQCLMHRQFGTPVFSACTVFPFGFAETPEGIHVSSSHFCGSVRNKFGLPLAQREADLRGRLRQWKAHRTDAYRIAPDTAVPWEAFRDAESVLRQVLHLEHLPLRRRLWMGARVLEAWMTGGRMNYLGWEREEWEPLEDIEAAFSATLLSMIMDGASVSLPELPPGQAFDLAGGEALQPELLVSWFENVLFSKELSYAFDLSTAFNVLIVLYLIVLEMEANFEGPIPERAWRSITAFVTHGGLTFMLETLFKEIPDLREPMGLPSYGMLFLRSGVDEAG